MSACLYYVFVMGRTAEYTLFRIRRSRKRGQRQKRRKRMNLKVVESEKSDCFKSATSVRDGLTKSKWQET